MNSFTRAKAQKEQAAERAHQTAESLRTAKDNLSDEQRQAVGRYADMAADQIDHVADYLREHDVTEIRREAEDVARQHPGVFLGAMLIGGLALGRFLRSGTESQASRQTEPERERSRPADEQPYRPGQSQAFEGNTPTTPGASISRTEAPAPGAPATPPPVGEMPGQGELPARQPGESPSTTTNPPREHPAEPGESEQERHP